MTRVCNAVVIDGTLEDVFDFVTTPRHWPRWHPATKAVSGVTDRPLDVGDQVRERAVIGGRAHEGTWTVAARERPVSLLLQIDGGRIEITYTCGAYDGTSTRLCRALTYRPTDFAGATPTLAAWSNA